MLFVCFFVANADARVQIVYYSRMIFWSSICNEARTLHYMVATEDYRCDSDDRDGGNTHNNRVAVRYIHLGYLKPLSNTVYSNQYVSM